MLNLRERYHGCSPAFGESGTLPAKRELILSFINGANPSTASKFNIGESNRSYDRWANISGIHFVKWSYLFIRHHWMNQMITAGNVIVEGAAGRLPANQETTATEMRCHKENFRTVPHKRKAVRAMTMCATRKKEAF